MHTGKSVSEALILESVNPQYDERLFIEFQEKYKLTTCCVQKLFFVCLCFDIQNNISLYIPSDYMMTKYYDEVPNSLYVAE